NGSLDRNLSDLKIYYDSSRTTFWVENDRGVWIRVKTDDVIRRLAQQGKRRNRLPDESVSEIESLLVQLQTSNDVDYADSLAGFKAGVQMINEHRILVRDSPKLIEPACGDWSHLQSIILNMLGPDQQQYFFGWLKIAVESLYSSKLRVGQALTLAGPRDS